MKEELVVQAFTERYGPWAFVAGASMGIGAALSHEAARRGLHVLMLARGAEALEDTAAAVRATHGVETRTLVADLADPDIAAIVESAVADLDIGLFVYNAAVAPAGRFLDVDRDVQLLSVTVNCATPVTLCHLMGRRMVARGRGGIGLVSSNAATQGAVNFATYNAADVDLGSGAIIVVPDQAGSHPHELIACGKPTPVYVLDRDNLGQLGATSDNIIQRLDNQLGTYATTTKSVQACFTGPAMWGQNVYFGGKYDVMKMFTLDPNTGLLSSAPVSQGTLVYGYPGADPVVSANGATNGIVWAIDTKTNALIANDATNLANTLFTGPLSVPPIRWTTPTVINGHVYVGEQGKVFGFQLK